MALFFEQTETTIIGTFGEVCRFPILNIAPMCDDEFLRNLPVAYARYEEDSRAQFLIDFNFDLTAPVGECDGFALDHEIQDCEVFVPNQIFSAVEGEQRRYDEDMKRFCRPRRLSEGISIFDGSGRLKVGEPLAETFLEYRISEMRRIVYRFIATRYLTGDSANDMEPDGILTQLQNGWDAPGAGECEVYSANELNWQTLTGAAGANTPDATMTVDTVTLKGQTFTGFTGYNFAELLRKIMLRIRDYILAGHNINSLFLAVGRGNFECIAEVAACLQPCNGCPPLSDPGQRDRLADFLRTRTIYLYPYSDVPIRVFESPGLGNNAIFGPWQVDGEYTMQFVFRDQAEQDATIDAIAGDMGWTTGLLEDLSNGLIPLGEETMPELEARTFMQMVDRDKLCIQPLVSFEWSVPVFALHAMFLFTGLTCTKLVPEACEETPSIAVTLTADVGGQDKQLDLTLAADPTCGTASGDVVRVEFTDGTVLYGTLVGAYNTGTNIMRLSFVPDLDNTTFGNALTVTCIEEGN